jgi:hypothetical protein
MDHSLSLARDESNSGWSAPIAWQIPAFGLVLSPVRQCLARPLAAFRAAQPVLNGRHCDVDGSFFDPAGVLLNGVPTQLSTDNLPNGSSQSGAFTFNLAAGDIYSFFAASTDSILGRGDISVSAAPGPIPGAGLLSYVAIGLLGLGSIGWKRLRAA